MYQFSKMMGFETPDDLLKTPKNWVYRGEGNCNIVISLPKSKQILRIRKTEKPKSILGWILILISDFIHWYYGKGFRDEIRDLNFYSKIMRPLIGNNYTSECKQVFLSRKQIQILRDGLIKERSEFRQNKTLRYGRAALFTDFAFLPKEFDNLHFFEDTFAVEIKPKQGWRPRTEQIYPQCFFCMNQFLKLEKRRIESRTKYCPEELFSGDKERMKNTLKHLIEVPQNNFRIFKNGLLYSGKHKHLKILKEIFESDDSEESLNEEFCDFLQRCLVTDLGNSTNDFCNSTCKNNCGFNISDMSSTNNIESKLPKGSVLERILSVQMLDCEGTIGTYKKLRINHTWEEYSFVDKILEAADIEFNNAKCILLQASKNHENELLFLPYLVSAIAKDCSLMISFRKLREVPCDNLIANNLFQTRFGTFLVNIGVFDLYPKPLSTIQKHYKRNKDIFKALKKCGLLT